MPQKRIFTAINISAGVRDALRRHCARLAAQFPESARFLPPEWMHFTLTFLGDQTDGNVGEVVAAMREIIPQFGPPEIVITKLCYGPPDRAPRMIWATTDDATSKALGNIKAALEDACMERGVRFERESRSYLGHLTLARLSSEKDRPAKTLPDIAAPLTLRYVPDGVALMESRAKRGGAEYATLAEVEFGQAVE